MKICFITRCLPFGKGEAFVIPEIAYAIKAGHQVSVAPLKPEGEIVHFDSQNLLSGTIKQPLCNGLIIFGAIREICRDPFIFVKLLKTISKSRNLWIFIKNVAVLPKALWLAGNLRNAGVPDHIHVHWIAATATMAMITATILKIPWSVTAHRWDIAENNLIKEKIATCKFVRCINVNGAKEIQRYIGDSEKIIILHMGVELPEKMMAIQRNQKPNRAFKLLMPANFVEVKGHIYLIQAIQLLRMLGEEVHADLAGEGPLKNKIQQEVARMGIADCVNFLGELSHSSLLKNLLFGEWDCVVLPSIVTSKGEKEGIPVSLIEAMAAEVPVVSTLTGGIPELCTEGTALLVPEKDPKALSEAVLLLMHDTEKRKQLIMLAQTQVKRYFDIKTIGPKLLEYFRQA